MKTKVDRSSLAFFTEADCEFNIPEYGISLAKANALIAERSIRVLCHKLGDSGFVDEHRAGWTAHEPGMWPDESRNTHQALLIAISPIAQDSAEKVLADLLKADEFCAMHGMIVDPHAFIERARKLLGAK